MKLFVSTDKTQGYRNNDFCYTKDKEILNFVVLECDGEGIDGGCGCRRSFAGLESLKSTTTAIVDDVNITEEELFDKFLESNQETGWNFSGDLVKQLMKSVLDAVEPFEIGSIVEKRGDAIQKRIIKSKFKGDIKEIIFLKSDTINGRKRDVYLMPDLTEVDSNKDIKIIQTTKTYNEYIGDEK